MNPAIARLDPYWQALVNLVCGPRERSVVTRVDAALVDLESMKGGAVHPIRSIPIDMIADVIVREVGDRPSDDDLRKSLAGILARFDPPRIETPSPFDRSHP